MIYRPGVRGTSAARALLWSCPEWHQKDVEHPQLVPGVSEGHIPPHQSLGKGVGMTMEGTPWQCSRGAEKLGDFGGWDLRIFEVHSNSNYSVILFFFLKQFS